MRGGGAAPPNESVTQIATFIQAKLKVHSSLGQARK